MHHNEQVSQCVWRTPARILGPAKAVLGPYFLDPATDTDNPTGAMEYLTEADDGLDLEKWSLQNVFLNPPWSKRRPIRWWASLAWMWADEDRDRQLIFVSPAATNAHWFHDYMVPGQAHCFPRGRVAFEMPPGFANDSAPTFDTCVTYFGRQPDVFKAAYSDVGWCP